MNFRKLTPDEIELLKKNNCSAVDWNNINVAEKFIPLQFTNVHFDGQVFIGNNNRIRNVLNLSNYIIEDDVLLENIASVTVEGETAFGNGNKIIVLNEGGGRELIIYDKLSSQIAYLLVTCRHNPEFVSKLETIIRNYSNSRQSKIGKIGKGSSIKNCSIIKNVWIENSAILEGVICLKEGTLLSSKDDPIFIGNGVIAKDFIIQSGSAISDGTLLDNCFIGQSVKIGKQYSAENCAFFSNCEAFHGEAVSIFAGPYTVTHHKSSLLIAAMFSFYNAGSGSNQSNHMYKLGPVHQGILERGSKTGSFSYMLWPSRVGPFSVVIGKHYTNFDAGEFPFSYINEESGKSLLTPAMNMFTVGTRRDSQKWPMRDRRKDSVKYDTLHFDLFNPFIIGKILEGSNRMKELLEKAEKDREYVTYKGLHIKRLLLKTCIKYYEMAIKIYIGEELLKRITENSLENEEELRNAFRYDHTIYSEKWIDAAGLLLSRKDYEFLVNDVVSGKIKSLEELNDEIHKISNSYKESSWAWCADLIEKRFNLKIGVITKVQLSTIIQDWKENRIKLNNMILKDAEKEFDQTSRIGFGIDGEEEVRDCDFENVRGRYEENKFVLELKKESEGITSLAERLIKKLLL
jgi:NDP-sugar pyrophosphorylase family protein